jgi:hypothetical protein
MAGCFAIQWLKRSVRRAPSGPRPSGTRRRHQALPRLEVLEERCTPTTVTTLNDIGGGSLRDAIAATPSGGTVDFAPGLTGTITLARELVVDHSLTITGPGAGSLTISGGNAVRVLDLTQATSNITLSGLRVVNGYNTGSGGGIENRGTLTVTNCTISSNFAQFGGGGIDNWGPLTLSGSLLSGNSTTPGLGSGGGALYNANATITVSNCTFTGNTSEQGAGIINNSGTLNVDHCTFSQNHGGAGGGVFNVFGKGTITYSTFSGNFADTAAGYVGGGIANSGNATLTVSGCTFTGNSAGTTAIPGGGGGIYNQDSNLTLSDSTLYGNSANRGGGIDNHLSVSSTALTVSNSTLYGNSAAVGGGICNDAGTLQALDTIVAGDTASSTGPDFNGSLTSQGHNLIGVGSGGSGYAASDLVGSSATPMDPKLGPLQNNGGPTQTLALLVGSPAIKAGDITGAPHYDQRGPGYPRTVNGTIDIGAFEVQNATTITPSVTVNPVNITYGTALANSQLSGTVTATVNGQVVSVPGSFAYTTAAGTILNTGNGQSEQVTFTPTDTTTYSTVQATVTVNVAQAAPVFSSLSSPTIAQGTASTTLSGHLAAGSVFPTGDSVSITLNGVIQTATVDGSGNFSSSFNTGALTASSSPYAISYVFAGDGANFAAAANGSGTLTVTAATLSATGLNIKAVAGAPFRGAVASFTDPFAHRASYTATISWGDGATSGGVISGTGSTLKVVGGHTYAVPGSYTIHVTITHTTSPVLTAMTTNTATVRSSGEDVQPHEAQQISFWDSVSGQNLILGFNGGATHTQLAAWLVTNFPDLYGPAAGAHSLAGKSNKDVAALFQSLYLLGNNNADVQVLATALNVYATTSSLGGGQGAKYGFRASAAGLGAQLFSVKDAGAAFGVANNTVRNVFELLRAVDQQAQNCVLYNGNANLQTLAENLLAVLNAQW